MTREEAITELKLFKESAIPWDVPILLAAIDMAIEALKQVTGKLNNPDDSLLTANPEDCKEQKSKLNLISRADAIEALGEEPPVWCDEEYEIAERNQWREDVEAIESVPSADRPRPIDPTITVDLESGVVPISACEPRGPKTIVYESRPKGEWLESREQNILMAKRIEKGETWRVCSNCGTGFMIGAQYEGQKCYGERFHDFCPRCGADMRGEDE